jgi:uncharacterized membrane protein YdjX (TVP38/TMEM64 family)
VAWLTGLGVDDVDRFIAAWGAWAAVGSMALMVLHSVLPLPGEIIAIGNGMMFGPFWGVLVTWAGAMLGAAFAFAIGRRLGRPALRHLVGPERLLALEGWDCRPTFLLLIRLVPVISFNLINYAAGLTAVSWWTFLWTTGLGILPITVASVLLGHELWRSSWVLWASAAAGLALLALAVHQLRPKLMDRLRPPPDQTQPPSAT